MNKLRQLTVEIIQKCLNNCLHCSSWSNIKCENKIQTNKVFEIIDSASKLNIEEICLSGGEPFLHEGLDDIVKYINDKGIKVSIYTSGIVSEQGKITSISKERLSKIKADKIIFGLQGISEDIYNEFTGTKGNMQYILASIDNATKLGIHTEIHFVPTKINIEEIEKVLEYAKKREINKVSFLRLICHGRGFDNRARLNLNAQENKWLKEKLSKIEKDSGNKVRIGIPLQDKKDICCNAVKDKLVIRYDGKVFGCEAFKNMEFEKVDSIYDNSLEDIYMNSEHLKQERIFINEQLRGCGCENCPVQISMNRIHIN